MEAASEPSQMGPQDGHGVRRGSRGPGQGGAPSRGPGFWVGRGLTMTAMPEKSTAETNCQTLGRHQ